MPSDEVYKKAVIFIFFQFNQYMFKRQKNPYQTNNQDFVASFSGVKERLILTPMRKESSKLQGTEQKMRITFGSFK
jgi:hypothetical protein